MDIQYSKKEKAIKVFVIIAPFFLCFLLLVNRFSSNHLIETNPKFIYLPGDYCLYIQSYDESKMCKDCHIDCSIFFDNMSFENIKGKFIPIKKVKINKIGYFDFKIDPTHSTIFYSSEQWQLYSIFGFVLFGIFILLIFTKSNLGIF